MSRRRQKSQQGVVLIGVLVMLTVVSVLATGSWQMAHWQQRMEQHQPLSQLALHAAESHALSELAQWRLMPMASVHALLAAPQPDLAVLAVLVPDVAGSTPPLAYAQRLACQHPQTHSACVQFRGWVTSPEAPHEVLAELALQVDMRLTDDGWTLTRWQRIDRH